MSNTYATFLLPEDNPLKDGLILHNTFSPPGVNVKDSSVVDGHAYD